MTVQSLTLPNPEALVYGTTRDWVWLKVPSLWPHTILTMPRSVLPRGMAGASTVEVVVDPSSLRYNGVHLQADLKVINANERRPSTGEERAVDTPD